MIYSIYKIVCLKNSKVYIGRTQEINKRWRAHKNMLRKSQHNNTFLQHDWNSYGEECFEFKVIHTTENLEEAIKMEQEYIDSDDYEKYNISDARAGGDTFTNNPRKEETRKIKSRQTKGENNPMYGKSKSEKTIQRIKEANSKPIIVDGVYYPSSSEASRITGIKITTILYRLNSSSQRFKDWNYQQK